MIISVTASAQSKETYTYKPESKELYNTIVHMDSVYFNAYNTCDMDKQAAIYADSIEFYHDKGGLQTSKQALLDAIKKNICGKVTRQLVPGSIEVWCCRNRLAPVYQSPGKRNAIQAGQIYNSLAVEK